MTEAEEKKGFTIRDRRSTAQPEESSIRKEDEKRGEEAAPGKREEPFNQSEEPSAPLPGIDFSSFIFSLSTSALLHLGEIPDPATRQRGKNLPLAKQAIDILGMLEEKTKGNLNPDEEMLMKNILADLRWRYVEGSKG